MIVERTTEIYGSPFNSLHIGEEKTLLQSEDFSQNSFLLCTMNFQHPNEKLLKNDDKKPLATSDYPQLRASLL